ncbi:MAG: hypothetical protein AAFZ17_21210 [Cyanobacteria bacterium J06650_10]
MPIPELNKSQLKIYTKLWREPKARDLKFSEIEKLMKALGAKQSQTSANILFEIANERWGMHRPHPDKGLKAPYIKQIRSFLQDCNLAP